MFGIFQDVTDMFDMNVWQVLWVDNNENSGGEQERLNHKLDKYFKEGEI